MSLKASCIYYGEIVPSDAKDIRNSENDNLYINIVKANCRTNTTVTAADYLLLQRMVDPAMLEYAYYQDVKNADIWPGEKEVKS